MIKKLMLFLFLIPALMSAQMPAANAPQMADAFRQDGKIYVVITVIAIIFVALAIFLFFIERRLARVEQEVGKMHTSSDSSRH